MGDPKAIVRNGYDLVSRAYRADDAGEGAYAGWLDLLEARVPPPAKVLDLGCGCGVPAARRLTPRYEVTGVDLSPVQIERARALVPGATFVCADMTAIEFADGCFDAIVCLYAVIHLPLAEQPGLLRNIGRWLRPGGVLVATVGRVLVDSERLALRITTAGLRELGWTMLDDEFVERFVGRSEAHIRELLASELGQDAAERWMREFRKRYDAAITSELRPVDGIEDALDRITAATCVASSSGHAHLRRVLSLTHLYERFHGRIFSASEVARGKPAPDLFLHAAARLGVAPSDCAVVEDSQAGVQGARAAGMRAFGFAGGVTPAAWLEGSGTVVFSDMRRLPELLEGPAWA